MLRSNPAHRLPHTRVPLSAREAVVVCVCVLLIVVGGAIIREVSGSTSPRMAALSVGGDFVEFYLAGRILNDHDASRLYDFELQEDLVPSTLSW